VNKTESLGLRVPASTMAAVDAAAKSEGITRSEWLEVAITRALGKRPRLPLATRVNALEKQIEALNSAMGL
jgi:uncharacterized protein (DUF1778 family)